MSHATKPATVAKYKTGMLMRSAEFQKRFLRLCPPYVRTHTGIYI